MFVDAMPHLRAIRDGTQTVEKLEEERRCVSEMRDRACLLLCACIERSTKGSLFAEPDVTVVVDILALATRTNELKNVILAFDLACCKGSRRISDFDHSRAQTMIEYCNATPRLRFSPVHLWFLYCYGRSLYDDGRKDAAEAHWAQIISFPAPHNSTPQLLLVQAITLKSLGAACEQGSDNSTNYLNQCLQLLTNAPSIDSRHLFIMSDVYMLLRMPEPALECLAEILSRGDAFCHLSSIFLRISLAAEMLNDYSFAIALTEQARLACEGPSNDIGVFLGAETVPSYLLCIENRLAELLYHSGQLQKAKESIDKVHQRALELDPMAGPELREALQLRAQIDNARLNRDWLIGRGGFRESPREAVESTLSSLMAYEAAVPNLVTGRSDVEEPLEIIQQRYDWMKQQDNVKVNHLISEGVVLCRLLCISAKDNKNKGLYYKKAREVVTELCYRFVKARGNNFECMSSGGIDMATDLGAEGLKVGLWSEPYYLFTAVLEAINKIQTSLVAEDTFIVESSNYYKTVSQLLVRLCLLHKKEDLAFLWSQHSKSGALSAQLWRLSNIVNRNNNIASFNQTYKNTSFEEEHGLIVQSAISVLSPSLKCTDREPCIVIAVNYTLLPPEMVAIHVAIESGSADAGVRGMAVIHEQVDLMKEFDEETRKMAEDEFWSLSEKRLSRSTAGDAYRISAGTSEGHAATNKVVPRVVAENSSRGQIPSALCLGLVALIQRLATEAENALGKNDKWTAEQKAAQMKAAFGKLYDIFIRPLKLKDLMGILNSAVPHGKYMLLITPDEDLGVLPFSAFYNETSEKYLIEEIAVVMAPSLLIADLCKKAYDKMTEVPPSPELVVGRTAGYPEGWGSLKKAKKEMQAVRSHFSNAGKYLHLEADEQHVKEAVLSEMKHASWLHFTVHGEISERFPRGSLLLGPSDQERLDADEISACGPLPARAVVLSACETGLGAIRGEGILGLVRAFFLAGVPLVIASTWKVSDNFTTIYMDHLYKKLKESKVCVPIAMQEVAIDLMKDTKPKTTYREIHILKWAAFACTGCPHVMFPIVGST